MEHAVGDLGSPALGRGRTYDTGKQTSSDSETVLQQKLARADERQVVFSKHAIARAEERGIAVTPALLGRLTDSVEWARAKGTADILALDQSLAFIVNIPHNQVVTTLSQDEIKENILANTDGVVVL